MNRRDFLKAAAAVSVVFSSAPALAARKMDAFRLTVYPGTGLAEAPINELLAAYNPLTEYLSRQTGTFTGVRVTRDIKDLGRPVFTGADFLLVPPTVAATFMLDGSFVPMVRSSSTAKGSLVARDKKFASLSKSSGARFVFTQKGSWLERMSVYALAKQGVKPKSVDLLKGQKDVVTWINKDRADIGCLRDKDAAKFVDAGGFIVAKLAETPDYTLMASKRIGLFERNEVASAMLALPESVLEPLRKGVHAPIPKFVESSPRDYAMVVEALKLASA